MDNQSAEKPPVAVKRFGFGGFSKVPTAKEAVPKVDHPSKIVPVVSSRFNFAKPTVMKSLNASPKPSLSDSMPLRNPPPPVVQSMSYANRQASVVRAVELQEMSIERQRG